MLISMFEVLGSVPQGKHTHKRVIEKKGDVREEQREKADEGKGVGSTPIYDRKGNQQENHETHSTKDIFFSF